MTALWHALPNDDAHPCSKQLQHCCLHTSAAPRPCTYHHWYGNQAGPQILPTPLTSRIQRWLEHLSCQQNRASHPTCRRMYKGNNTIEFIHESKVPSNQKTTPTSDLSALFLERERSPTTPRQPWQQSHQLPWWCWYQHSDAPTHQDIHQHCRFYIGFKIHEHQSSQLLPIWIRLSSMISQMKIYRNITSMTKPPPMSGYMHLVQPRHVWPPSGQQPQNDLLEEHFN